MRKRTINHLSDTIFWYIIYLLPVMCYLILLASRHGGEVPTITAYFENFNIPVVTDLVTEALLSLFGSDGILPLFGSGVGVPVFSWYISMMIIHLAVDFLLFIPRLCHKWLNKFTQNED